MTPIQYPVVSHKRYWCKKVPRPRRQPRGTRRCRFVARQWRAFSWSIEQIGRNWRDHTERQAMWNRWALLGERTPLQRAVEDLVMGACDEVQSEDQAGLQAL